MVEQATQSHPETTRQTTAYSPVTDIYETQGALVLLIELPGVEVDDVDISVENRVLAISGHGAKPKRDGYTLAHAEYRDVDYQRSFTLSEAVDTSRIEASMTDGLLRLTLPKSQPAPAKKIAIRRI